VSRTFGTIPPIGEGYIYIEFSPAF